MKESIDHEEEMQTPSASLSECTLCKEKTEVRRRRAGSQVASGTRGWGFRFLMGQCLLRQVCHGAPGAVFACRGRQHGSG